MSRCFKSVSGRGSKRGKGPVLRIYFLSVQEEQVTTVRLVFIEAKASKIIKIYVKKYIF
jgi:hypothetical protein